MLAEYLGFLGSFKDLSVIEGPPCLPVNILIWDISSLRLLKEWSVSESIRLGMGVISSGQPVQVPSVMPGFFPVFVDTSEDLGNFELNASFVVDTFHSLRLTVRYFPIA